MPRPGPAVSGGSLGQRTHTGDMAAPPGGDHVRFRGEQGWVNGPPQSGSDFGCPRVQAGQDRVVVCVPQVHGCMNTLWERAQPQGFEGFHERVPPIA